ncbi:phytase [Singulisphaera sp. PoT]|uniref:phytase n=1 Tax=Singulisphaera sp. PoT TaxID=3411797 RepID=UPI003BF5E52B
MCLSSRRLASIAPALFLFIAPESTFAEGPKPPAMSHPTARRETPAVPTQGDAADDPAIWIHPNDPGRSLVLGTNKKGGLHVHSLDGSEKQSLSPDSKPNNVDLIYGFKLGNRVVDLAVASSRAGGKGKTGSGLKVWTIDPASGHVDEIAPGVTAPTFGGSDAYGLCTYRSPRDDKAYAIVTNHDGKVEQYRLDAGSKGPLEVVKVRSFELGSQAEGCVADRETGKLYIGEEDIGIWEYSAEPDAGDARTLIAKVGENGLADDVEGLCLYYAPEGKGYLIASSQGNSRFLVFERSGRHEHVLTIDPEAGSFGDIDETDGIEVSNEALSGLFPDGLFVVQDGKNDGGQNFKFFGWKDVAGGKLLIDTTSSARKPSPTR